MVRRSLSMLLVCTLLLACWVASPAQKVAATAVAGNDYTTLTEDTEITLNGETLVVDLAGYDLTLKGTGTVYGFDTANDTFDHLSCGILTADAGVTINSVYEAPNGGRYVALSEGRYATFHRLDMEIKTVSLRMSNAGLYYKAFYQCDRQVAEKVTAYGVAVSLEDVPGADFKTTDGDAYTVCTDKFVSGATATSSSVVDIMKEDLTAAENLKRSRMPIYANAYIDLGDGPIMADTANVGKKAGISASLAQVLAVLDGNYSSYRETVKGQLRDFNDTWKTAGVNLNLTNIGADAPVDWDAFNADLIFDEGTTNAWCPACEKKVTWTAMTNTSEPTTAADGAHYYLPDDLIFENDNEKPFMYAPGSGQKACFHLNGHNVTNLNWRVFHSGSGKLSIMGNGTVAGYNKKSIHGAAIHSTNKNAGSEFILYGGTYAKVPGTPYNGAVIYISDAGGNLTVYEDVVIQADASGKPGIYTATNTYRECNVTLHGCTVNGTIYMESANNPTNLEMIDTTVKGNITARSNNFVTLSGKVTLTRLTTQEDSRVTVKSLDPEAYIKINADGEFSAPSAGISKYLDCFVPYNTGHKVYVRNNALCSGKDYTSDLVFAEGTTDATCPVCAKTVTWTEIVAGDSAISMVDGGHYYLAEDQSYTGGGNAFLSFASKAKVCVHLNGHNLTSNTRALYTGTGTTNIMGTGIVTGTPYSETTYGAALHHNSKSGTINLYSGTYRQSEGVDAGAYTLNMHSAGGTLNVYEDAVIEGNDNGNAIRVGNAGSANISVNVYDATVNGKVTMVGTKTPESYMASLTLDGAKVNGTVDINGTNNFTVVHDAQIGLLDMEDTTKVTLDRLIDGADITVKNAGEFAYENESAADYVKYFKADWINDKIVSQDNILTYKINYTCDLLLDAENKALCPACGEIVRWTAFTDDTQATTFTDGGHFYLTEDLFYEGTDTFLTTGNVDSVTCLHLNGNDITTTNGYTIFISGGYLNMMGEGTVKGNPSNSARGTVIYANNKTATNGASLYSGIYTKYNMSSSSPVIVFGANGGNVTVYEDALIDGGSGMAVNTGAATNRNATFLIEGATIKGNVTIPGASGTDFKSAFETINGTITGTVKVNGTADVTFSGRTKIGKLIPAAGQIVNFENMLDGSAINVSADGVFSSYMTMADEWLQYFSTADSGDWLIVRDKTFFQGTKTGLTAAEQTDIDRILAAYGDRVVRFGEAHNHSSSGPVGGADGYNTIAEWKEGMEKLHMDFAVIVDHRQSSHMYVEGWNNENVTFLGGTETGTDITDLPDGKNNIHMNLIFSDPAQLEALINSGHPQFTNVAVAPEGWSGYTFKAGACSKQDLRDLAALVRELGGFFAHVHPKYDGYVDSDDPLDYYYGEYTGIEVVCATGSKSDSRKDYNKKAYDLWVDLLELDKKVYATYGNDDHSMPSTASLTAMYTETKAGSEYMQYMRAGDFTPGWVGVRMQVGETLMGGTTSFEGQRLVIAAGDMFADKYDATHEYAIQLYDDGGLLFESELNPSEMNYYAMDADPDAKFYRVLIWDTTIGAHVAVGNPIWNG